MELTERVRDRLERLRQQTEADSLTEVIRRALTLYDMVVNDSNGRVVIRSKEGVEQEIVVL
ncbi:MAG TPA: hypothetical protein VHC69_02135 [Polyangiaceae bacterium]|nr:hypothetical protein [Polyangiaceae bacterium]